MNLTDKIKNLDLNKLFNNKKFSLFFSICLAIIIWFIAVGVYDPQADITINNVPISTDGANSSVSQFGLTISSVSPSSVSVKLNGPRYKLSRLNKDDINITPVSTSGVVSAETFDFKLTGELKNPQSDVSISFISPNTASFTFDSVSSKTIKLTSSVPNIKAENGFILQSTIVQPETLTVHGPEKSIKELSEIKLINNSDITINSTKTFDCSAHFIDINGNEMDSSLFTYNQDISFKVTVPVFKQKQVPLTFKYKNAPSNFDFSKLNYSISTQSINIMGASDSIDNINEINLGYIDFRELEIGKSFTFSVPTPSGFINMDSIETATINFDSSNWAEKTLTVYDIQTSNVPSNFNVNVISSKIKNVKVVGLKDEIKDLSSNDITATIDFSNQDLKEGSQSCTVSIGFILKTGVWSVGDHKCFIYSEKTN